MVVALQLMGRHCKYDKKLVEFTVSLEIGQRGAFKVHPCHPAREDWVPIWFPWLRRPSIFGWVRYELYSGKYGLVELQVVRGATQNHT